MTSATSLESIRCPRPPQDHRASAGGADVMRVWVRFPNLKSRYPQVREWVEVWDSVTKGCNCNTVEQAVANFSRGWGDGNELVECVASAGCPPS